MDLVNEMETEDRWLKYKKRADLRINEDVLSDSETRRLLEQR